MTKIKTKAGLCEVCLNPTETLYLDFGRYLCALCCNPRTIKELMEENLSKNEM